MVNSMFYGNQAIYQRWIDTQEEAINWFLDLFGLPDEDFKLTFAAGDFPDFYEPYDITSLSRSWNTSINIPLAPAEIVELLTSKVKEAGAEVLMETPACQLIEEWKSRRRDRQDGGRLCEISVRQRRCSGDRRL